MSKSTLVNQLPSNLHGNNQNNDEENMIREALEELHVDDPNDSNDANEYEQQQMMERMYMQQQQQQMQQQQMMQMQQQQQKEGFVNVQEENNKELVKQIMKPLLMDIQTTIYVVIIFFIVSIIPMEKLIFKYISLNKVPYSDIIIKAILAGIIFFVLTKL
jgi:hypothetical protein